MPYLRDTWYVGSWGDEITAGRLLPRTILEIPVLFFRRESDGAVVAMCDRCPHRFAPLHLGRHKGDAVQCIYHGLTFDASGRCIHNPQGAIPRAAVVQTYPTVERDGIVWIWLGRAEAADPCVVPDFSFLTSAPKTARIQGYIASTGHYELMTDNILDLSHIDFLHTTSLGSGSISTVRPEVTQGGDTVTIRWVSGRQKAAPIYDPFLPEPGGIVDQVMEVTWYPPGLMKLTNAMHPVGHGPERSVVSTNVHLMTPESPTSTHYFYTGIRNFAVDDAAINDRRSAAVRAAFVDEDKPMIEAVQRSMGSNTDILAMVPILLPSDAGAIRARRILRKLLEAEAAKGAPPNAHAGLST